MGEANVRRIEGVPVSGVPTSFVRSERTTSQVYGGVVAEGCPPFVPSQAEDFTDDTRRTEKLAPLTFHNQERTNRRKG